MCGGHGWKKTKNSAVWCWTRTEVTCFLGSEYNEGETNTVLCTQSTWKAQISNYSRFPSLLPPIKQVLFTLHLTRKQHLVNNKYHVSKTILLFYYAVWCTTEVWMKEANKVIIGRCQSFCRLLEVIYQPGALLCKQALISSSPEIRCLIKHIWSYFKLGTT